MGGRVLKTSGFKTFSAFFLQISQKNLPEPIGLKLKLIWRFAISFQMGKTK